MELTAAKQCGNMAIFRSGEVTGFVVLVEPETSRAVGREASRAWVIRYLADLPSLFQAREQSRLQIQRSMISLSPSLVLCQNVSVLLLCFYFL